MRRSVLLFTTNHPFSYTGGETMFVAPELPHLAAQFESLCVVPLHDSGAQWPLPPGVQLDRGLAARWRRLGWWHALCAPCWPGFGAELRRGWQQGGWVGAARVWRWAAVALATWAWLRTTPRTAPRQLLYSYWRGGQTLAAARWAATLPGCAAVTRVHRYELYDEAFEPPFQPWTTVYGQLQRVITIAQQASDYLRDRGVAPQRLLLARLGVAAAAQRAAASADGVWRVVSCANLITLKRVDLNAKALCALAARHPQQRFEWTHFGGGPALPSVRAALRHAPPNLHTTLAGQVPNAQVLAHYRSQPVDLFVLLSASEGLPVAIQEALAHGVPVLASDVGGVAEAVNASGDNGRLLPVDAPLQAIVAALEQLLLDASAPERAARRDAAWQRWSRDFDAERNHAALARQLALIETD